MGKGMGLTPTRKEEVQGHRDRQENRDRGTAGTDRPKEAMGLTPLNLHGDRRGVGTDRMTGYRHRDDPEKEKEYRAGRSHRTDPKGERWAAGTNRHTEGRHRADPEREKERRDEQMGGSHKTDAHGLRTGAGTKGKGTAMEVRGTSRIQQPRGATRSRESHRDPPAAPQRRHPRW